ncbi:MAG: DedA family protein [Bryobacteraceae bacterium]
MHWFYHAVTHFLLSWGYWAVAIGVGAEDAGIPVPGETTLMFASFLAHKSSALNLYWIIIVSTVAASAGDNLGFLLGRKFGETLLRWIKKIGRLDDEDIAAAKDLIKHHGGKTVFFARFIFGLRTITGPLAGMLDMEWPIFLKFNLLGAAAWSAAVAGIGYAFANEFQTLLGFFEKASWALAGGLFAAGYMIWRRYKKKYKQKHRSKADAQADA